MLICYIQNMTYNKLLIFALKRTTCFSFLLAYSCQVTCHSISTSMEYIAKKSFVAFFSCSMCYIPNNRCFCTIQNLLYGTTHGNKLKRKLIKIEAFQFCLIFYQEWEVGSKNCVFSSQINEHRGFSNNSDKHIL